MKQKRQKKSSSHTVAMLSYVPSFNSSIVWDINFGCGNLYIYIRQTNYKFGRATYRSSKIQTHLNHMQLFVNSAQKTVMEWCHFSTSLHCNATTTFGFCSTSQDDSNSSPPDNWKRPPGRLHITWLNTVQWDPRAYNLTLNEAVDLAQNCPLWRLMSTYGATHS